MYNANNYGYNPYSRYMPPQPMMQQSTLMSGQNNMISANSPVLSGKMVESEDIVKNIEIPLDGSTSYFPVVDGSAIITKQLQNDGTSKMVIYKPTQEDKKETIRFATLKDIQEAINDLDLSDIQGLKDEIKEIKKQLKEFKTKKSKDDE